MFTDGEIIAFVCLLVVVGVAIWGLKRLENHSDDDENRKGRRS